MRAFAGWRGEVNIPDLTQLRPDLLLLVREGPYGPGPYAIELERHATFPGTIADKLRPYRRAAEAGRAMPVLFVCETRIAAERFAAAAGSLPLLSATEASVLRGPLTGDRTVWGAPGEPVSLRCEG